MNKIDSLAFDKIHKEVFIEAKLILFEEIRTYMKDMKSREYPDLIPRTQVIEEYNNLAIYVVEKLFEASVRASTLVVQKYHDKFHS